jgi:hypothetical protein
VVIKAAVDNDILLKGCGFGLLADLLAVLPAHLYEIGFLGSAKFVVAERLRKANIPDALATLEQVIQEGHCFEPTEAEAKLAAELEYQAQRSNLNVDFGESLLCAVVIERTLNWLVTGDKRGIRGLELLASCVDQKLQLAGKVLCLEQLVLRLLQTSDAARLRSAICSRPGLDRSLTLCFSCASPEVKQESWAEALVSYVQDMRNQAPSILAR